MRLKSDLILLFAALIWGITFVIQRIVANDVGIFLFNGARFLLAALVLLPFLFGKYRIPRKELVWVGLTGLLLGAGSALQQAGLRETTAANAGFITSMYVVLVPILMALVLKHQVGLLTWAAALVSVAGAFLLSAGGKAALNRGDLLELAGTLMWAFQIIMVGRLSRRLNILPFAFGQFIVAGGLQLALGLALESSKLPALVTNWWAVAFSGVLSVGVGFSLQAYGQKHSPPSDAAILMSTEAVFAALFGYLVLHEKLAPLQMLGCAVIMAAIILVQFKGGEPEKIIPQPILRVIQEV